MSHVSGRMGAAKAAPIFVAAAVAAGLSLPLALSLAGPAHADAAAGRKKVAAVCHVCHGLDGLGTNPMVPNLAGENSMYITKQLKAFRSGQRQHEQMSIIASGLTDDDIKNVADYYSSIKVTVDVPQY